MIAERIIKDPRPFSDPTHPIHEHPSVKPHPEDYAKPSPQMATRNLRASPVESARHLGITLTDNGTIIVDGIEMSVQFVKQFLTNADGKHLFAFKREGNRMLLTQIADAKSANEYFTAQEFS